MTKPLLSSLATLALGITGMTAGGCLAQSGEDDGVDPEEPDAVTPDDLEDQTWWNRAVCDTVRCEDPGAAETACEAEWGENNTQGRTYNIFASCTGSWTNSDCYSDCFRNYCQCGSTAGTPNACAEVESDDEWPECMCGNTGEDSDDSEDEKASSSESSSGSSGGIIAHRYWCCSDRCGTIHGWSDTDYCGC